MTEYLPPGTPPLDFASLAAWLGKSPDRRIGRVVVIRWYGLALRPRPPVISMELHGTALAFIRPDSVTFPASAEADRRPTGAVTAWLSRIAADNGLGTSVRRILVSVAPGVRIRRLALDGNWHRQLAGRTFPVPEHKQETVA